MQQCGFQKIWKIALLICFLGRGKPGWGKDTTKPVWWPKGVPWANVRMDARENEDKQKVSWTHALRQIVINCYKYHGREDLLPVFSEEEAAAAAVAAAAQGGNPASNPVMGSVGVNPAGHQQQVSNDATEKKPTIIHNVVSNNATNTSVVRKIYINPKRYAVFGQ